MHRSAGASVANRDQKDQEEQFEVDLMTTGLSRARTDVRKDDVNTVRVGSNGLAPAAGARHTLVVEAEEWEVLSEAVDYSNPDLVRLQHLQVSVVEGDVEHLLGGSLAGVDCTSLPMTQYRTLRHSAVRAESHPVAGEGAAAEAVAHLELAMHEN